MVRATVESVRKLAKIRGTLPLALLLLCLAQSTLAQIPHEYLEALKGRHTDMTVDQAILQIVAGAYPRSGAALAGVIFDPNHRRTAVVKKGGPTYLCGNDSRLVAARRLRRKREDLVFRSLQELGTPFMLEALVVADKSALAFGKGARYNAIFEARLVRELGKSNSKEVKRALMRLETSCTKSGRHRFGTHKAVLEALASRDPHIALPRLSNALNSAHNTTKAAAIEILGKMENAKADRILLSYAPRARGDRSLWHITLRTLGARKVRATAPELLHALRSDDSLSREIGASYLGHLKDPRCFQPLLDTLAKDPKPSVRLRAAGALGDYGDPRAIPALRKALKDPHKAVQTWAKSALKRLGD